MPVDSVATGRTRLGFLGPVIVGVSAWCAAGEITLVSATSASERLVRSAPIGLLVASVLLAALVGPWRRRPATATPALLATLPWWPIPLPAAALIWTGPLASLPIVLALFSAVASALRPLRAGRWATPRHALPLVAAITVVATTLTAWSVAPRLPSGDEPHYLVITQSVAIDGDLAIENNHARRDYASYFAGDLRPDFLRRGQDGAIYSIHAPGVSVLVLPGFELFGYRGAQATLVFAAVATSVLIWYAAWLTAGQAGAAWFAWAAVASTVTFLLQSITVFPDGPGALVVAAGAVLLLRLDRAPRNVSSTALALFGAALACLPWFHTRFVVIAVVFGVFVGIRLLAEHSSLGSRLTRLAAFFAAPAAGAAAWFGFFWVTYGTANPAAPYGPDPGTRFEYIAGGIGGILFDQQFGLLAYSPVLAALAVGVWAARRVTPTTSGSVRGLVVLTFVYLATVGTYWMWWAGVPAPPARFAAAVLPALAPALGVAWKGSSPALRAAWAVLLVVSIATSAMVIAFDHGALMWNVRGVTALWLDWLGPLVALDRAWPSFFWRLVPGDVRTELPFAVHILVWWTIFAITLAGFVTVVRARIRAPWALATLAAWWLAGAVMLTAEAGWRVSGGPKLDPIESQVRWLSEKSAGSAETRIGPFSLRRQPVSAEIRLRVSGTPNEQGHLVWDPVGGLPAGSYDVHLRSARVVPGSVTFRLGRAPEPLTVVELAPRAEHTVRIALPPEAAPLVIEPGSTLRPALREITLTRAR